jgi:hypothetical protein
MPESMNNIITFQDASAHSFSGNQVKHLVVMGQ